MRIFLLVVVLFITFPLCAQKNIAPLAKAALGKNAIYSTAGKNTFRLLAKRAAPVALPLPQSDLSPHVEKILQRNINSIYCLDNNKKLFKKLYNQGYFFDRNEEVDAKRLNDFMATLTEIEMLKKKYQEFDYDFSFEKKFFHISSFSSFAMKNNQMVLVALKNYIKKIQWLQQYPNRGRNLLAKKTGNDAISQLAKRLKNEKIVMLGEYHYVPSFQKAVKDLILALKAQNPRRRVVVFTEFINLPETQNNTGDTLETYYRVIKPSSLQPWTGFSDTDIVYAEETFSSLVDKQIEIYPLEDLRQMDLLEKEFYISTLLATVSRNKTWARVIETKMAEIHKTDPDALFVVYAGRGHLSWLNPLSLPKFFVKEKPKVIQLALNQRLWKTSLRNIWPTDDPFFTHSTNKVSFFFWTGADATRFAQNTGFDYLLALP